MVLTFSPERVEVRHTVNIPAKVSIRPNAQKDFSSTFLAEPPSIEAWVEHKGLVSVVLTWNWLRHDTSSTIHRFEVYQI